MPLEVVPEHAARTPRLLRQPAVLVRRIWSFPVALSALLVVLVVLTVRNRFNDPDMWWHLKTGEIIWNTRHLPVVDTFSYTAAGHAWILQEWLAQLSIYTAYHLAGYTGLMLWLCTLASLLLIAAYALCSLYSGNAKVAFLGALVVWLFSTVGLAIRPHLVGYLLLIAELAILHLGRTRTPRWFYALPPLFCLWINSHGSFFLGLVLLAIMLCCSFCELQLGLLVSHRWPRQLRTTLLLASAATVAALFLNPIGPKLIVYPLNVLLNQHVNLSAVSEWQPPQPSDGRTLALFAAAALVLLIPVLRCVPIRLSELLCVALGFGFAVRHARMEFVFGILVAPVLCRLLADTWDNYRFSTDRILPNAIVISLASAVIVLSFPNPDSLRTQVEQHNPVAALAYLRNSGLSGRMLNEYLFGGYLIWAAPQRKVFVDGRADIYDPAGVLAEYGRFAMLQTDPTDFLARHSIRYCLLLKSAPAVAALRLSERWKQRYADDSVVILARDD